MRKVATFPVKTATGAFANTPESRQADIGDVLQHSNACAQLGEEAIHIQQAVAIASGALSSVRSNATFDIILNGLSRWTFGQSVAGVHRPIGWLLGLGFLVTIAGALQNAIESYRKPVFAELQEEPPHIWNVRATNEPLSSILAYAIPPDSSGQRPAMGHESGSPTTVREDQRKEASIRRARAASARILVLVAAKLWMPITAQSGADKA